MRTLFRNRSILYYSIPQGNPVEVEDDDGYKTGNFAQPYSTPTRLDLCVMPKGGESDVQMFGADTNYSLVALSGDRNCPINEQAHIWVDLDPVNNPHNYIVKKAYRSLNSVTYALQEVNVK